MKKNILLLLLTLNLGAYAQQALRSEGPLPADLKLTYEQLYESDLQRTAKVAGGRVKDKDAVERVSFSISKLLSGGRILFGDPVTQMLNRIVDTLLSNQPELRRELRIYTVKSPEVNAFTTPQGMIFVNTGLVAQVENEAQLAFILSHEIIHYVNNHAIQTLLSKKKKKSNIEDEQDELDELLRRHSRSREMEAEADSLGIAMFYLASPYDKQVVDGVFDVLQYSALPYGNIPFDRTLLDAPLAHVGNDCWLENVDSIKSHEDYDDTLMTHPNILKRRAACGALLAGKSGGAKFLITTEEEFAQMQLLARKECLHQELIHVVPARALYDAYLLLKIDSNDAFATRCMAQALYQTVLYRMNGTDAVVGDFKKVEGESQQVYHMLRVIDPQMLALTATRKIWLMGKRFPDDNSYQMLTRHLLAAIHEKYKLDKKDFTTQAHDTTAAPAVVDTTDLSKLSRLERIRHKRNTQAAATTRSMNYAFADLLATDAAFAALVDSMDRLPLAKESRQKSDRGQFLYRPTYIVDNDKTGEMKPRKSIDGERRLIKEMEHTGHQFGQSSVDFSNQSLATMTDAEQYNNYVTVNEWMTEFWQSKGAFPIHYTMQPAMDSLLRQHHASTVNMTMVVNSENVGPYFFSSQDAFLFVVPPIALIFKLFPPILYSRLFDHQQTAATTLIIDATEGKILTRNEYHESWNDDNALLASMIYDASLESKQGKPENPGATGLHMALTAGASTMYNAPYVQPTVGIEYALGRKISANVEGRWQLSNDYQVLLSALTLRYYSRTEFAPLGRYWGLGAFYGVSDNTEKDKKLVGFTIESGHNYIFKHRFLVNLNFHGNIALKSPEGWLPRDVLSVGIAIGFLPF